MCLIIKKCGFLTADTILIAQKYAIFYLGRIYILVYPVRRLCLTGANIGQKTYCLRLLNLK